MVINAIIVTIDSILGSVICQAVTHRATRINENSLIWATVNPVINQSLLEYQSDFIIVITIIGFQINTNNDSKIIEG